MAGQQISIEAAYEVYRSKAADLFHENALLRAQITEIEAERDQLRSQVETLTAPPRQEEAPLYQAEPSPSVADALMAQGGI